MGAASSATVTARERGAGACRSAAVADPVEPAPTQHRASVLAATAELSSVTEGATGVESLHSDAPRTQSQASQNTWMSASITSADVARAVGASPLVMCGSSSVSAIGPHSTSETSPV